MPHGGAASAIRRAVAGPWEPGVRRNVYAQVEAAATTLCVFSFKFLRERALSLVPLLRDYKPAMDLRTTPRTQSSMGFLHLWYRIARGSVQARWHVTRRVQKRVFVAMNDCHLRNDTRRKLESEALPESPPLIAPDVDIKYSGLKFGM